MAKTREKENRDAKELESSLGHVRTIVATGALAALLIGRRAWIAHPVFGPVPVFDSWGLPPDVLLAVWHAVLVALLVVVVVRPRAGWALVLWCLLFVARAAWDRMTWQPYWLEYLLILLALSPLRLAGRTIDRLRAATGTVRLVLACCYVWAGIAKLDRMFMEEGFTRILEASKLPLPIEALARFAPLVPVVEIAIGVCLIVPRLRTFATWGGVAMHAGILLLVGPLGRNDQFIVWPWNVALAACLVALHPVRNGLDARGVLWPSSQRPTMAIHCAALLLVGFAPALAWWGAWDRYLALRIYSYQIPQAFLDVTPDALSALGAGARRDFISSPNGRFEGHVLLSDWCSHETGVALPPEERVFHAVARRACALAPAPGDVALEIQSEPSRLSGTVTTELLDCDTLMEGQAAPQSK